MGLFGRNKGNTAEGGPINIPIDGEMNDLEVADRRRPMEEITDVADLPSGASVWHMPDLDEDVPNLPADQFDLSSPPPPAADLVEEGVPATSEAPAALMDTPVGLAALVDAEPEGDWVAPVDSGTALDAEYDSGAALGAEYGTEYAEDPLDDEPIVALTYSMTVSGPASNDVVDILDTLGVSHDAEWDDIAEAARRLSDDPDEQVRVNATRAYVALRLLQV